MSSGFFLLASGMALCTVSKLFPAQFVIFWKKLCWCSSVVELLICNQPVAGSNPVTSLLTMQLRAEKLAAFYRAFVDSSPGLLLARESLHLLPCVLNILSSCKVLPTLIG